MSKLYLLSAWAMLLLNFILLGIIRATRKRHAREVINLIDDSTTSRDKVSDLRQEIQNYSRIQQTDQVMIERLLRCHDRDSVEKMEQRILLSKYQSLSGFAYERCQQKIGDMTPGQYQLVRETLRQLYNLEKKPDAGKPTGNRPTEGSQTV